MCKRWASRGCLMHSSEAIISARRDIRSCSDDARREAGVGPSHTWVMVPVCTMELLTSTLVIGINSARLELVNNAVRHVVTSLRRLVSPRARRGGQWTAGCCSMASTASSNVPIDRVPRACLEPASHPQGHQAGGRRRVLQCADPPAAAAGDEIQARTAFLGSGARYSCAEPEGAREGHKATAERTGQGRLH